MTGRQPVQRQRSARSYRLPKLSADRLALIVPTLISAVVTILWFPWDRFLAAGDIAPFLPAGDAPEVFELWNHRATGSGSTSASAARFANVLLMRVTDVLGGSEVVAQHIFYALVMGFAAFGSAYLARAFVRDPVAIAVAGLLGSFNIFVLIHLPNPLTMIWIGMVGTLGGMLVLVARGVPISPVFFAVVTLPASWLSVNPPSLATSALTVIAVACACNLLVGPGASRRALAYICRALPWVLGLNLWWIVLVFISTVWREGLDLVAVTRVEDWAWSHTRNSIPNILSLTAHWGWLHRDYLPWAESLDAYPWALLRWILPLLAVSAVFLVKGRQRVAAWTFVGAGLGAALVAKGLHWPIANVNLWAYHNIPGYWLLRDPMSKVGGILLLSIVVLAGMTIEVVLARAEASTSLRTSRFAVAALGAVVCLAIAFPYPLFIGRIGPDGKSELPSSRVALPSEWRALADALNDQEVRGKALVLPLNSFYQVTTDWGYHGVDKLASQLLTRPVLSLRPEEYFFPSGLLPAMLRGVERELLRGNSDRVAKLLQLLGVSHVILRDDLRAVQVVRDVADRDNLASGLEGVPGIGQPAEFGVAQVFPVTNPSGLVWAASKVTGLTRRDDDSTVSALADLPTYVAAVDPETSRIDGLSWEAPVGPTSAVDFDLRSAGRYAINFAEPMPNQYRLQVGKSREQATLTLVDPVSLRFDGEAFEPSPARTIAFSRGEITAVAVGDQLVSVKNDKAVVRIDAPSRLAAYRLSSDRLDGENFTSVGDCGPRAKRMKAPTAKRIPRGIQITARAGRACVKVPVGSPSEDGVYMVRFEARQSDVGNASVCLWMAGPNRCAPMLPVRSSGEWTVFDSVVRSDPGTTELTLFLYSTPVSGVPSVASYRDVIVTPLEIFGEADVAPVVHVQEIRELSSGTHRLEVSQSNPNLPLKFDSPLGDCHRYDDRTPEETGLRVQDIPDGLRLEAAAHAACVNAAIPSHLLSDAFTLSMDVRTVRGQKARSCLWLEGPNRCATIKPLPSSSNWKTYVAEISPDAGTTGARLFLYADAGSSGTITEYRRLSVGPVSPVIVDVTPVGPQAEPANVEWSQSGASSFKAKVSGGDYPAFLVLDESFGHGWQAKGIPTEQHVEANGYANGWTIASGGTVQLTYGPNRWSRIAMYISVGVAIGAIVSTVFRRKKRRRNSLLPTDPFEPSTPQEAH